MSGPKYGIAELSNQIMLELLESLNKTIEECKCKELETKISLELKKISDFVSKFKSNFNTQILKDCLTYIPNDPDFFLLKDLLLKIEEIPSVSDTAKDSNEQAIILTKLSEKLTEKKNYQTAIENLLGRIRPKINQKDVENKLNKFLNTEFVRDEAPETLLSCETYNLYLELISLSTDMKEAESVHKVIDELVANQRIDDSYKQKQIRLRIESLKASKELQNEIISITTEIHILLKRLGKEKCELPTSIEKLTKIRDKLSTELQCETCDDYIGKCVSEVLEEIGYNIVHTETIRFSKRVSQKKICDLSVDSILQASTSTSGAVMFEVMSRKKTDEITDFDRLKVKTDMDHFCPDYAKIKAKLAERGIILTNENLSPASVEYVRGSGFGGNYDTSSSVRKRCSTKGVTYNVVD